MSNEPITATVQTLTAEVHVLRVGKRQVTLSVYRQLDQVRPNEIEPFGRVRDNQDTGRVNVIGRRSTGELVRSAIHAPVAPDTARAYAEQHRSNGRPSLAELYDLLGSPDYPALYKRMEALPLIVLAGLR